MTTQPAGEPQSTRDVAVSVADARWSDTLIQGWWVGTEGRHFDMLAEVFEIFLGGRVRAPVAMAEAGLCGQDGAIVGRCGRIARRRHQSERR